MLRIFIVSLVSVLWSTASFAYIPPSGFITKSWVKSRKGLKNVRIRTQVTAYSDNQPTQTTFKEVLFLNTATLSFDSFAVDDTGKKLYTVMKKLGSAAAPVSVLLLSPDSQVVISSLVDQGIPIRKEKEPVLPNLNPAPVPAPPPTTPSGATLTIVDPNPEIQALVRVDQHINRVAWVIGATDSKDQTSPQIWFEKDTFYPLKLLGLPGALGDATKTYEVRFENFETKYRLPFPRITKVLDKKGETLFISELIDISANAKAEPHPSHIAAKGGGFTSFGDSASSSLKDLIQYYYDVIR